MKAGDFISYRLDKQFYIGKVLEIHGQRVKIKTFWFINNQWVAKHCIFINSKVNKILSISKSYIDTQLLEISQ